MCAHTRDVQVYVYLLGGQAGSLLSLCVGDVFAHCQVFRMSPSLDPSCPAEVQELASHTPGKYFWGESCVHVALRAALPARVGWLCAGSHGRPLRLVPVLTPGWPPCLTANSSPLWNLREEPDFTVSLAAAPSWGVQLVGREGGSWLFISLQLSFKSPSASNTQSPVPAAHKRDSNHYT